MIKSYIAHKVVENIRPIYLIMNFAMLLKRITSHYETSLKSAL